MGVKWRHSNLWSHTISMLWGNTAYCVKLSGEDLSRYSNKTESVGLRKCPYCHYLTKKNKWCHDNKHFSELAPHHGVKTAGIDVVWKNYVTVTLYTGLCDAPLHSTYWPVCHESMLHCGKTTPPRVVLSYISDDISALPSEWGLVNRTEGGARRQILIDIECVYRIWRGVSEYGNVIARVADRPFINEASRANDVLSSARRIIPTVGLLSTRYSWASTKADRFLTCAFFVVIWMRSAYLERHRCVYIIRQMNAVPFKF